MADVKWLKIVTDIFDDEKILLIEDLPDRDSIIVIWFKLLCLAGKQNNNGVFIMNNRIAYTDEMFATIFRRPLNTVRMALNTFEQYGMIEIIDNVVTIPNWEKHQSIEGMEKIREQNRIRKQNQRERQKLLISNDCHAMSRDSHAADKEEDKERDKNKNIDYVHIKDMFNEICVSFPRITTLSEKRKKAIKARLNTYTVEQFKEMFEKAEASDFLKGSNKNNWQANFDWLICDSNFAKVLDGNYENKKPQQQYQPQQKQSDYEKFMSDLKDW